MVNHSKNTVLATLTDFGATLREFKFNETHFITINQRLHPNWIEVIVRLRRSADWNTVNTLYLDNQIDMMAGFQPDGRTIVVSATGYEEQSEKRVNLWDIASGELLHSFTFEDGVYPSMQLSQKADLLLITGGNQQWLYDISIPTSPQLRPLPVVELMPAGGRFSPNDHQLVLIEAQDEQYLVRLWDIVTEQEVARITHRRLVLNSFADIIQWTENALVLCEIFRPENNDYQITFWSMENLLSQQYPSPFMTLTDTTLCRMDSYQDDFVAIPTYGQGVQSWFTSGSLLQSYGDENGFWRIAKFSVDRSMIMGVGYFGTMTVWNTSNGQELATVHLSPWGVEQFEYYGDTQLVTAGSDGTLRLWGIQTR